MDDARPIQTGPLRVEFRVEPTSFTMAAREKVVTAFVVTNTTSETIDPKLDRADLLINGEPSLMWSNTNGNGGREPEWTQLPPGGHVSRDYTIADTLFEKPGDYRCQLRVSGILSAPVTVHVSP